MSLCEANNFAVTIATTVTSIGTDYAACLTLISVIIASTVTTIGKYKIVNIMILLIIINNIYVLL